MKIVYVGLRHDKYYPSEIFSFEYNNFYLSLKEMSGIQVIEQPFDRILESGKDQFNRELLDTVQREKPDLVFAFMLTDELLPLTLDQIKKHTTTLAWFSDDHWRFHNYSRFWAPHFTWNVTTYSKALEWYKTAGIRNVIRSQWAANANLYKPLNPQPSTLNPLDVSFVGGWNYPRSKIIASLQRAGIKVQVYGNGWPNGRATQEQMLQIFSQSKINLGLNPAQGIWNKNSLGRLLFKRSVDKIVPDFHIWRNFQSLIRRDIPQIKARHFEIPSCRGFLLTSLADDLDEYFKLNQEIAIYNGIDDLIQKIKYYLMHEEERKAIANNGYQRTIQDHTYQKRFHEMFRIIGLAL